MKPSLIIVAVLFLFIQACKETTNDKTAKIDLQVVEKDDADKYPESLSNVFKAHGGLDLWKKQHTLEYTIPKPTDPETHTIDLKNRKDKITTPNFTVGYDGKTWIVDEENKYTGNPEFYHNLMFYFYAMPFVLADDGIRYGKTEALEFDGKSYPGISISYDDGVGTSPKDEYYLHYDPETDKMAWLGYTVTYRTGEESDSIKWIRYDDWTTINGLLLPKSISWYNYEGRQIMDKKNTVQFENISISEDSKPDEFYNKPENGSYFKKD